MKRIRSSKTVRDKRIKTFEFVKLPNRVNINQLPENIFAEIFSYFSYLELKDIRSVCKTWSSIIDEKNFMKWEKLYYNYKLNFRNLDENTIPRFITTFRRKINLKIFAVTVIENIVQHVDYCLPFVTKNELIDNGFIIGLTICKKHFSNLKRETISKQLWCVIFLSLYASSELSEMLTMLLYVTNKCDREFVYNVHDGLFFICLLLLVGTYDNVIPHYVHYRLFYVLYYLKSKGLDTAKLNPELKITNCSQDRVKNHRIEKKAGRTIKVEAFAGTGKTTTIVELIKNNEGVNFLFLCYNKNVQKIMNSKCLRLSNVECRTFHSLAHVYCVKKKLSHRFGFFHKNKIHSYLESDSTYRVLLDKYGKRNVVNWIDTTIDIFICSDKMSVIELGNVNDAKYSAIIRKYFFNGKTDLSVVEYQNVATLSQSVWNSYVINDKDCSKNLSQDILLKLYQLSKPKLSFDCVIVDECQDLNGCMMDIATNQTCEKILVGDPYQQIYSFRFCTNDFASVVSNKRYILERSYRFGHEISELADLCLFKLHGCRGSNLIGKDSTSSSSCLQLDYLPAGRESVFDVVSREASTPCVILAKTNFELFCYVVNYVDYCDRNRAQISASFVGPKRSYCFSLCREIYYLKTARVEKLKQLSGFKSYENFVNYSHKYDVSTNNTAIKIVEQYDKKVLYYTDIIDSDCFGSNKLNRTFLFSTVHKAKGQEFSTVFLTDSFGSLRNNITYDRNNIERNLTYDDRKKNASLEDLESLLYVGITRAKNDVRIHGYSFLKLLKFVENYPTCYPACDPVDYVCINCQRLVKKKGKIILHFKKKLYFCKSTDNDGEKICPDCYGSLNSRNYGTITVRNLSNQVFNFSG